MKSMLGVTVSTNSHALKIGHGFYVRVLSDPMPTTDGREIVLSRYTQPEQEVCLLLVRPAGRTPSGVQVPYAPGKGKH